MDWMKYDANDLRAAIEDITRQLDSDDLVVERPYLRRKRRDMKKRLVTMDDPKLQRDSREAAEPEADYQRVKTLYCTYYLFGDADAVEPVTDAFDRQLSDYVGKAWFIESVNECITATGYVLRSILLRRYHGPLDDEIPF